MAPPITVKALRAEQWRELRDIRLRALRDSPEAFLTTTAQAENEPDEFWSTGRPWLHAVRDGAYFWPHR